MSYLITAKIPGDVDRFRTALAERSDEFVAIADRAKGAGAIRHRFGLGDGFVFVVDEWDSPAQFEGFFTDPALQEFVASAGGDTSAHPEITVAEYVSSADEF